MQNLKDSWKTQNILLEKKIVLLEIIVLEKHEHKIDHRVPWKSQKHKIYQVTYSLFTWSKQKWFFWRAGFYPSNQNNLKSYQKALIGWKKAGPPKKPLLFWSCKQAIKKFGRFLKSMNPKQGAHLPPLTSTPSDFGF